MHYANAIDQGNANPRPMIFVHPGQFVSIDQKEQLL